MFFCVLCLHLFYENFGRKSILRSDRFHQSESRSRTEGTSRGREERGQRVPGRARTSERTSQRERHSKPQLSPFVCNPFPGFPSPGRLPLACHQRLSVCGWFGAPESTSERLRRAFPRVRDRGGGTGIPRKEVLVVFGQENPPPSPKDPRKASDGKPPLRVCVRDTCRDFGVRR